ncbi:MAG TPA: glycosyltransferase family 1 protein [Spirochaetota bacterium]|nr:glycosyltransferase family 1 protein [Spirochaetota bacterium]HPV42517.1 glycosyltransferase family 1 protein [Spirochaetota bacterium]
MKQTKKIRVALFADVLKENLDGVTYTLYNILERVPRDKFDFLCITPYPPSDLKKFPFPVVVCRYIKMPLYGSYPLGLPYFDKNLENALKEFKPDLVHFTTPSFLGRYARTYAVKNNLPLVSTYHTHFPIYVDYYFKYLPFLKFLKHVVPVILKFYYNKCNLVYVPTKPVLEDLVELGIERDRMMIWARGIDSTMFNPKKRDTRYINDLCGKDTIRILFVSRLFWVKEITTIIGIYKKLSTTHPNVRMVITGDGPQKKYMEKRMPGAVFTGKLINSDLYRIYASCDIFLFPSITETFGNVNLEALASGLPVVAAAKGGQCGIIQEGKTGYLVEPKNIDAFCEKLSYLVNNPNRLKQMSKNAIAYARSQKWDTLCREMFKSYERLYTENKKIKAGD